MAQITDMPINVDAYLRSTTHLSTEQSGAYLHLLMHSWANGSLPGDEEALRRITRVEAADWSAVWAALRQLFDFTTGLPVQSDIERARLEAMEKKGKAVAKAKAAADKRWSRTLPAAHCEPQPGARKKGHTDDGAMLAIEAAYKAYPRRLGKGDACKAIRKAAENIVTGRYKELPPMAMPAALEYLRDRAEAFARSPAGTKGEHTPYPATWFNGERFLDADHEWYQTGDGGGKRNRSQERSDRNLDALRRASGEYQGVGYRSAAERHREGLGEILDAFPELAAARADGSFNVLDDRHIPQPDGGRGGSKVLEGRLV